MSIIYSLLPSSSSVDAMRQALVRYLTAAQSLLRLDVVFAIMAVLVVGALLKWPDCAIGTTRRTDLKGDRGLPLVGNFLQFMGYKHNILQFFIDQHNRYRQMHTFTFPGVGRFIMVHTPELIEYVQKTNFDNYQKQDFGHLSEDILGHGIFVSNGAEWRMHRKTASNMFTTRLYRDVVQHAFKRSAQELGQLFEKYMSHGEDYYIELQQEFPKLTLNAFGKMTFGIDFHALETEGACEFNQALDYIGVRLTERVNDPLWKLRERYVPSVREKVQWALKTLNEHAYMAIENRRKESPEKAEARHKDMLDHFINYKFEDGSKLSDKELRDIFMNFMFAGRDTTAQTLVWQFYLILTHPDVEAKLRQEIDQVLEGSDDYIYETLTRDMAYTKAVFYETLRLYPPVAMSGVVAVHDDVLPDGTRVGAGDIIGFSAFCLNRELGIWGPDATEFRPERFLVDDPTAKSPFGKFKNENPYKFNCFNAGPRICLGQTFATLEGMVTTIYLLQHYDFKLKPNHPVPEPTVLITTAMSVPLEVRVVKRQ
ncbi:hypothetical protein BGW41_002341 [Actinomortierella wolfii]|nr:hypothetical protein BGW41_002341 [Actinomortierella wolfii]